MLTSDRNSGYIATMAWARDGSLVSATLTDQGDYQLVHYWPELL